MTYRRFHGAGLSLASIVAFEYPHGLHTLLHLRRQMPRQMVSEDEVSFHNLLTLDTVASSLAVRNLIAYAVT